MQNSIETRGNLCTELWPPVPRPIDLCHTTGILSQEVYKKLCLCAASLVERTRLAACDKRL